MRSLHTEDRQLIGNRKESRKMNMSYSAPKVDGRTKEARAAKRAARAAKVQRNGEPTSWVAEYCARLGPLDRPEVLTAAASEVERALLVRNSVRRKLLGGSVAVNTEDLTRCEGNLSSARTALELLAADHPLILASNKLLTD